MESVHLQLPADLLARIDEARGMVPRNPWIRWAIERALGDEHPRIVTKLPHDASRVEMSLTTAPLSSSQAKRDVRPVPKGK